MTERSFEARVSERVARITECVPLKRQAQLRWPERIHLVRAFAARRLMKEDQEAQERRCEARGLDAGAGRSHPSPHPLLLDLARLMGRAAAEADILTQRRASEEGEPA
ncbi:hypothetical protein [Paracoccus tibetensis]|uniref:Uncharacterized protein n=1 Tax=Paracoccus tibetensis TaxID=336292 RepID=A0A1G5K8D9_9RHOB|nr:hypothetical protein [Paracoccus tibetensis]SCY96896.1 hypothetical protein SAMN05660710_03780 [Paracoccus tibetensis]